MQPWRETAKAPQALANFRLVGQSWSVSQPLSRPEKKPSPAPSTLKTSIGKPGPVWPSSRLAGIAPSKATAPLRAALADQRRVRDRPHRAQRRDGVGRAAGDVELLLGADDEVEEVQRRLQLPRDLGALDEAALALAVAGDAPEVRAVVDVERRPRAVLAGEAQRLQHRRLGPRVAEMGAGGEHRPGLGDEALVDVGLGQPHVGAVLAIEDQREALVVADAEDDQRGQPLGIDLHSARVDPLPRQLLDDEPPHVLVADAGDNGAPQPEPRRAAGDVGRRATDVLREAPHVLQAPTDLVAVEVDRRPPDGDEVQRLRHSGPRFFLRARRPGLTPRTAR